MIQGKAIKFGNNIDTDQIIGAQYLCLPTIEEIARYTFDNYPHFTTNFTKGDIVVGQDNFGCGSSREQAPAVLKEMGVAAIVACSFARIFFRNAINLGIMLIECPEAYQINHLDELEINNDRIRCRTTGREFPILPLPDFIRALVEQGGIIASLQMKNEYLERC
jgi:3-isopropylmalate/(R)-2-methylmalate dehydratase small subunit